MKKQIRELTLAFEKELLLVELQKAELKKEWQRKNGIVENGTLNRIIRLKALIEIRG